MQTLTWWNFHCLAGLLETVFGLFTLSLEEYVQVLAGRCWKHHLVGG